MTSLALSTADQDAITRTIDVRQEEVGETSLDVLYEVDWTVAVIQRRNHRRIALQFPDELLHISVPLFRSLKAKLDPDKELYVLADTTYGSCCVDEVAAQHVDADVVVHYGHACLSPTSRIPAIYVFGQKPIDADHCAACLVEQASTTKSTILLLHDVAFEHQAGEVANKLQELLPPKRFVHSTTARVCEPSSATSPPSDKESRHDGISANRSRNYKLPDDVIMDDCAIFYIGGESLALTNILMTHSQNEVWSYDPTTRSARLESIKSNKLLMRRYALVQKARDADVFAILIGTLGVAQYLPMINHVREQLKKAQKKSYTVSVGKLNPSKLGNLIEIECYVLVACPENSVIDSKDFLRPIITPYELEMALGLSGVTWTGKYVLDFERVLEEVSQSSRVPPESDEENDPDQPHFSLVTGKYRHAKRFGGAQPDGGEESKDSSALTLRNQDTTVARFMDSAGGQFLQSRTYQGLDPRLGLDKPSPMEQGRSGIARGYGELQAADSPTE